MVLFCFVVLQLAVLSPLLRQMYLSNRHLKKLSREVSLKEKSPDATPEVDISKAGIESLWPDEGKDLIFSKWYKKGQKDLFIKPRPTSVKDIYSAVSPGVNLAYSGLFRTEKDTIAMVKDLSTGKNYFKKEGDEVSGYKIMEIKKDTLTLSDTTGSLIHLPKGGKNYP